MTGYEIVPAVVADGGVVVQWFGDISLNGPFCDPQHAVALQDNLREVAAGLGPSDLRIANWESPLWGDGRVNSRKMPRLATLPHAVEAVRPLRLDVALLANNHVYDCLETGFENTVATLRSMGVSTLGAALTAQDAAQPLVIERSGTRLGLLNYVGYDTHPNLPVEAGVALNWFQEERAVAEIALLRRTADAILVHLHWGSDEFVALPSVEQRRIARRLIEAGAMVVVGGHAHVFQGHERWRHGYIFHGMGNFLFWPPQPSSHYPRPWPKHVRQVSVASCHVTGSEAKDIGVRHLLQEGLLLRLEETPGRRRVERRLCRALRLADRSFARVRRIEAFQSRQRFRLHAMRQAGGLWPWLSAKRREWTRGRAAYGLGREGESPKSDLNAGGEVRT